MNASPNVPLAAPLSPDDLDQQIEAVRADLARMATMVSDNMSAGIESVSRQIGRTGRDARATAIRAVREHPLAAVGIAAGAGLLLGLILRKG